MPDLPNAPAPAQPAAAAATTVSVDDFRRLDLRTATVLSARPHPNADRLVCLCVRVGEREKQIVAGIRKFRDCDALVGRVIVIVDNLQPAVLRGERSEGMLLAILDPSAAAGAGAFALVAPDAAVRDGLRVT
jgi:methionyl-tRNA synthetase